MPNRTLTLGSLFDGSGGFPLGALISGITPVWASEIEPFPIRVTTKRMPFIKHYGDVAQMDGSSIEPVDIITFGSPCQDMSIAGKRFGLEGSRSSLFYEAIRIVKEMRCATGGSKPRYILWENVPGAFSSNKGQDFRSVLEAICSVKDTDPFIPEPPKGRWNYAGSIVGDNYSVAWRTLDAQFWGVPQRRRRIYLVADFAGGSAEQILFESEGLSGYTPQSFRSWQAAAGNFKESIGEAGRLCLNDQGGSRMDVTDNVTATLRAEAHHPPCIMENSECYDLRFTSVGTKVSRGHAYPTDTARTVDTSGNSPDSNHGGVAVIETPKTLKIRSGCNGGGKGALIQENVSATLSCNNDQTLFEPLAFGICSKYSNAMKSDNPNSGFYEAGTSRTLDGNGGNPACNQGGIAVVEGNGSRPSHHGDGYKEADVMYTLNATEQHAVAFCPTYSASKSSFFTDAFEEKATTLMATDYKEPPIANYEADPDYVVRRLTPTECARLQGFPDWWCSGLETAEPTAEDISWWSEVFETYRRVTGTSSKPKSAAQIIKWLKAPYSDSAEYKMWGNGVCLNIVVMIMFGIKWAAEKDSRYFLSR